MRNKPTNVISFRISKNTPCNLQRWIPKETFNRHRTFKLSTDDHNDGLEPNVFFSFVSLFVVNLENVSVVYRLFVRLICLSLSLSPNRPVMMSGVLPFLLL